ncbi:Peptidoglycan deacetylase [bacterium HR36]|nr:Peptidoglycan deacetylase [bacterium HR36]
MTLKYPSENPAPGKVILSFDIEAAYHIHAARSCRLKSFIRAELCQRVVPQVEWLRRVLEKHIARATFFWVGELAWEIPYLVRAVYRDGHEIGCHGWSHRTLSDLGETEFVQDVQLNKSVLEDITGDSVIGFRAPTFSLTEKTGWGVEVLSQLGFAYDSSVYPVIHDQYGVSNAPRGPFRVKHRQAELLEFPPATWQVGPIRLAIGGGGHFRFWPLIFSHAGIRQLLEETGYATVYFHPWEFDEKQPRLPLNWFRRWRTYVGIRKTKNKLQALLRQYRCISARQALKELDSRRECLPSFRLGESANDCD